MLKCLRFCRALTTCTFWQMLPRVDRFFYFIFDLLMSHLLATPPTCTLIGLIFFPSVVTELCNFSESLV